MRVTGLAPKRAFTAPLRKGRRLNVCFQCRRRIATDSSVFAEGDIVLLRQKDDNSHSGILTKPLRASARIETHKGTLQHSSIIGRRVRDIVKSTKDIEYRIHEPTLAEYVRMSPRLVTPIYPADANLIVSLLDIHVSPPTSGAPADPRLEILEAGTGHGAMTLYLSRAIHAANTPPPATAPARAPSESSSPAVETSSSDDEEEDVTYEAPLVDPVRPEPNAYEGWRKNRRAVIHSIEVNAEHSKQAQRTVSRFRRGLYAHNVDFHVGDVSSWLERRMSSTDPTQADPRDSQPFLSHVFLDLPSAEQKLAVVAKAMRVDGVLAVFNPSVTQIGDCVKTIKQERLPFQLDRVVELGAERVWDVRVVRPRAWERMRVGKGKGTSAGGGSGESGEGSESESEVGVNGVDGVDGVSDGDVAARDLEQEREMARMREDGWRMVCRPKVGDRVVGGGFFGSLEKNEGCVG